MSLEVKPVISADQKKLFIDIEWQLNKNVPHWVSPLRLDRKEVLDKKKNPFFQHAEIELFIAYKNGQPVGRIAAITNENHNKYYNDKSGFWGFFCCENNQETADALFKEAANWLKSKGRDQMLGPVDPSTNDQCGLLIEGFDSPPFIMMNHNPPYYQDLAEKFGHKKAKDLYAWFQTTKDALDNISEKMYRVSTKIREKYDITIRNISSKRLDEEIKLIKEVYNNAWSENWGFVPFTDDEINHVAANLKLIADEELLLIAEQKGKPIGFSVSLPNVNEIFAKIPDGKLLPSGIFKLLLGKKKIKDVRVIILGVSKEYQFLGLGSIFYIETITRAYNKGYRGGEMSWILEDNTTMNKAIEAIGSNLYKKYRMYTYPL